MEQAMIIDAAPPTEHVYQVSDVEQLELLKKHFSWVYQLFVDYQYVPHACYEKIDGLERYFSGLPTINFNAVIGDLSDPQEYAERIQEQLEFFGNTPFFWYVEESALPEFKEALKKYGFIDVGIFRGVIGALDETIVSTSIPQDCVLEMVQDENTMEEFNDLVCDVFAINSLTKSPYQDLLWSLAQGKECQWYHWIARKQGKVVSAVSTMIRDGIVSFWNGASLPEVRKQGFSTALRHFSLQHAMAHGARFGSSYLMSEGLAFGICSKLGYTTKWRFHAFASPAQPI
jgi:hypothetical protein